MAWIEVHQSLPTHRKTLAVADALGIEPVQVVGHLTCLWLWALDNAPEGNIDGVSAKTLARAAQWKKSAERFVGALVEAGFISDQRIHDWPDYAGRLLERRRRDAERKRTERGSPPDVPPPSNGRPPDNHRTSYASRAHITVPNRTVPDLTGDDTPFAASQRPPPGGTAHDERRERSGKKPQRTEITEADVAALVNHYAQVFGSQARVQEVIDKALNHANRYKAINEVRYVELTWLRGDLRKMGRALPPTLNAAAQGAPGQDDDERPRCPGCGSTQINEFYGSCLRCLQAEAKGAA